jgi:hypothetical protein
MYGTAGFTHATHLIPPDGGHGPRVKRNTHEKTNPPYRRAAAPRKWVGCVNLEREMNRG